MLAPMLALAQCWNWDRFFAPCWNLDADIPKSSPCQCRAPRAGTALKTNNLMFPVPALGTQCRNWTSSAGTESKHCNPKLAPVPYWHWWLIWFATHWHWFHNGIGTQVMESKTICSLGNMSEEGLELDCLSLWQSVSFFAIHDRKGQSLHGHCVS